MKCLGLHNKPKAEVHPGHKLMGPKAAAAAAAAAALSPTLLTWKDLNFLK
jgi:hypothetical protein